MNVALKDLFSIVSVERTPALFRRIRASDAQTKASELSPVTAMRKNKWDAIAKRRLYMSDAVQ